MAETFQLGPASVEGFLRDAGLLPDDAQAVVEELSGGISNIVMRVRSAGGCVAVKQSLPPPGGTLWKNDLLRGKADPVVAGRAGELLGRIHTLVAADAATRKRFADQTVLVQGRTDPYHVAVAAG